MAFAYITLGQSNATPLFNSHLNPHSVLENKDELNVVVKKRCWRDASGTKHCKDVIVR